MIWPRRATAPEIGPLRAGQAAEASALHGEAFAHGWTDMEMERLIADPACVGTAGCDAREGELLGFVLSRVAADEAEILTIAVASQMRRRGLGAALLAAHLAALGGRGVRRLFLEVEDGNAPALALYRRFGFIQVGRREAYYRKPDGGRAAALVLRRDLD